MAQQSKTTSRTLTKAVGTASILSMAIAGANMANAIQTDFGVDYRADAFYLDGDAYGNDDSAGNGLANLLRVKANFKDENTGVSIHTSIQLAGDYWTGDSRDDNPSSPNSYNNDPNESVTLDTGYVQIPVGGNLIRVGRQAASWSNCFLACDDRRDRFSALFPTSVGTFVFNYDRRNDTDGVFGTRHNGDSPMLAYLTKAGNMNVGVLWVHFLKNTGNDSDYGFHGMNILSPYISGSLTDGVNVTTGFNYVFGNEENGENGAFGDGMMSGVLEVDDAWSAYARLDGNAGAMEWGLQYAGAFDGGLIDPGFDTYSSILNNNPASTQNPTSLVSMGRGLGVQNYDEHLLIGKLGFNVTPKLKVTGAVGWFSAEIDNGPLDADDTSMIYDLSASYQVNEAVTTVASIGMMTENEGMYGPIGNASNSLAGAGQPGAFADEDLMAANVGVRVKF